MVEGASSKRLRRINPHVSAERIISKTRFLNASSETVFGAFTKPRRLAHWWLAPEFAITTHSISLVPGGVWWSTIRRSDRHTYLQAVTYSDIEWARVLSYYEGDATEPDLTQTFVTFEEFGVNTKRMMRKIFASADARDHMLANQRPEDSQSWVLDRLSEYLTRTKH